MRIFYKPFGIVAGLIGAKIGSKVFQSVWRSIEPLEPPEPTASDASLPKVVAAAALEAATMAAVGAMVDWASARAFHHLVGAWPGKSRRHKTLEDDD